MKLDFHRLTRVDFCHLQRMHLTEMNVIHKIYTTPCTLAHDTIFNLPKKYSLNVFPIIILNYIVNIKPFHITGESKLYPFLLFSA